MRYTKDRYSQEMYQRQAGQRKYQNKCTSMKTRGT